VSTPTSPLHAIEPLERRTLLAAIKVMPLGDSITEGLHPYPSHRFWLFKKLEMAGYDIDFVGSRTGVHLSGAPNNQTNPPYIDWDLHHEGHAGWTTGQVLDQIDTWAPQYDPEVVLLHLGTNDMAQSHSVSGAIQNLDDIIDTLRSANPSVKVLLAKIIPARVLNQNIQALNAQIPALAAAKSTQQSPVVVVDHYAGFSATGDLYDDFHPNRKGEVKMANKWFAALGPLLGAPANPPPPVTYVSDLNWTSATNGWGPVERDYSLGENFPDDGGAIELNEVTTLKGLGVAPLSEVVYNLGGEYARFRSDIGVDDEVGSAGSVRFQVYVDNVLRFTSSVMTGNSPTQHVDVDVIGAQTLRLVVNNGGDGDSFDHADWAAARLITAPSVASSSFAYATAPHQLSFTFRRDVSGSIGPSDLLLENLTTGQTIAPADMSISYNTTTDTAVFSMSGLSGGILPDGNYRATILASGVTDAQGNPMLEDYVTTLFFQMGDANHDARVNLEDFNILATNFGQDERDFTHGDFNYDGRVNLQDFNVLASRFGTALPASSRIAGDEPDAEEDDQENLRL
jgi:lysophospholipase L1-like esterase